MYFSLPKEYREATTAELRDRIEAAKEKLGSKLVILAHHYQRLEIVGYGDHVGDSYGLAKIAAENKDVEVIVFCGVHTVPCMRRGKSCAARMPVMRWRDRRGITQRGRWQVAFAI